MFVFFVQAAFPAVSALFLLTMFKSVQQSTKKYVSGMSILKILASR